MNTPDLATLLPRFFTEHLVQQRNVSPRTVTAYRDTFRLLLRFLLRSRRTQSAELPLHVLTATSVLAFLSHLESERGNSVRSRNARLAAIRSFLHYASDLLGTKLPEPTRRALSIPWKRYTSSTARGRRRARVCNGRGRSARNRTMCMCRSRCCCRSRMTTSNMTRCRKPSSRQRAKWRGSF